jgi:HEAT repeat protein
MEERRKVLIQLLRDPHEEVRRSAAEALERLEGLQNLDTLIQKYRSGDRVMKLRVIYALGKLRADTCLPVLIHALASEEEELRAAAIRVLGELGDARTLQALVAGLNDPSLTIQTLTVEALANFHHQQLVPLIVPILERENKYLVMAALHTLAKLNAAGALEAIIRLTGHGDADIRKTAAAVLGEIEE